MATLAYQSAKIAGTALTFAAATSGGDKVPPDAEGILLVVNGSGSSITVTVAVPGKTRFGQDEPDVAVAVAAGKTAAIGPLPQALADSSDGLVHITYSAVTTVTVAAVRI